MPSKDKPLSTTPIVKTLKAIPNSEKPQPIVWQLWRETDTPWTVQAVDLNGSSASLHSTILISDGTSVTLQAPPNVRRRNPTEVLHIILSEMQSVTSTLKKEIEIEETLVRKMCVHISNRTFLYPFPGLTYLNVKLDCTLTLNDLMVFISGTASTLERLMLSLNRQCIPSEIQVQGFPALRCIDFSVGDDIEIFLLEYLVNAMVSPQLEQLGVEVKDLQYSMAVKELVQGKLAETSWVFFPDFEFDI